MLWALLGHQNSSVFDSRNVLDLGLRPTKGFGTNLENWAIFGPWVINGNLSFWIFGLGLGFGKSYEEGKKVSYPSLDT